MASTGSQLTHMRVNDAIIGAFVILYTACDLEYGGFGMSNSRFISFMDSFNSCYKFRRAVESSVGNRREEERRWTTHQNIIGVILCAATKFGSGSSVSLLLGHTPTLLRGPRHILSFLVAYAAAFMSPRDVFFEFFDQSRILSVVMGFSIALYKFRKLMFVMHHASAYGFIFTLATSVLAIEGNSILRNAVVSKDILLARLDFPRYVRSDDDSLKTSRGVVFWSRRIVAETLKITEVIVACVAVYSVCTSSAVHSTEPHLFDVLVSITTAEIHSCALVKWFAFSVLIWRYIKGSIFREQPSVHTDASIERSSRGTEDDTATTSRALLLSPFTSKLATPWAVRSGRLSLRRRIKANGRVKKIL